MATWFTRLLLMFNRLTKRQSCLPPAPSPSRKCQRIWSSSVLVSLAWNWSVVLLFFAFFAPRLNEVEEGGYCIRLRPSFRPYGLNNFKSFGQNLMILYIGVSDGGSQRMCEGWPG